MSERNRGGADEKDTSSCHMHNGIEDPRCCSIELAYNDYIIPIGGSWEADTEDSFKILTCVRLANLLHPSQEDVGYGSANDRYLRMDR
ncbi:hypothetical protein N7455_002691 [Penicillium solitum]|uniref:uncharacterized protein n=1 Tax=Penicillium solitum TaxID=60172 RepID=UPI0032C425BF|nr:hypothetical protein N7455_002691 [Penicillium solitum]